MVTEQKSQWIHHSVQLSLSVVTNYLWPHGLQHARLRCPSSTPGACSNSCPSNQWCHPTISSSVIPFLSCPQSIPASGSFLMSQFFALGSQSIGASTSVLPMNIQDWFPLGLSGLILQSKGLPRVFSNTTVQKYQSFGRKIPRRRKWQSTPVLLPGEFHRQRSLVGYRVANSLTWLSTCVNAHTHIDWYMHFFG